MSLVEKIQRKVLIARHIKQNYKPFLIAKATTLANQLILDEITNRMRQEKFSSKIIDRTYVKSVQFIDDYTLRINIVSDFVSESGFDVALAREFGTDNNKESHRHWVSPKVKKALSWISQGKRMFSPGHYVKGIKSLHIINNTIEEKKPVLIKALKKELQDWRRKLK